MQKTGQQFRDSEKMFWIENMPRSCLPPGSTSFCVVVVHTDNRREGASELVNSLATQNPSQYKLRLIRGNP